LFGEIFIARDHAMRRLRRAFLPYGLDEFGALLAQNPLHAANGIALAVEQMPYAAQQIDVVRAVVTAPAATLHRLDFVKAALPEAQHMLRQIKIVRDFTDGAKCVWRLVVQSGITPDC